VTREDLFSFAEVRWGVQPDFPWPKYPGYAILRHKDSGKWFAAILDVEPRCLGIAQAVGARSAPRLDIVNLKCQPPLVTMLLEREGVYPGYHMSRRHWVSIPLAGPFPSEELFELLELSWRLTLSKARQRM